MLVTGLVDGTVRGIEGERAFELSAAGDSLLVGPSDFVDYRLDADRRCCWCCATSPSRTAS